MTFLKALPEIYKIDTTLQISEFIYAFNIFVDILSFIIHITTFVENEHMHSKAGCNGFNFFTIGEKAVSRPENQLFDQKCILPSWNAFPLEKTIH